MALEIERKWLVEKAVAEAVLNGEREGVDLPVEMSIIRQTYVLRGDHSVLRLRTQTNLMSKTHECFITVKGPSDVPGAVEEHEMAVPIESGISLMESVNTPVLTKMRYCIPYGEFMVEVDEFTDPELNGLVVAEVEFPEPDMAFIPPEWFGTEVTGHKQYANASLVKKISN